MDSTSHQPPDVDLIHGAPASGAVRAVSGPGSALVLCVSIGVQLGVLGYAVTVPFADDIPTALGVLLSVLQGGFAGVACWPVVLCTLHDRDHRAARVPMRLWGAVIVAALVLAFPGQPYRVMGISIVLFIAVSLVVRGSLPRLWRIPGHCRGCGYDLCASHEVGRCPECGLAVGEDPAPVGSVPAKPGVGDRLIGALTRHSALSIWLLIGLIIAPYVGLRVRRDHRMEEFQGCIVNAGKAGRCINLSEAAPFAWDVVYVFDEYSSQASIEQATGLPCTGLQGMKLVEWSPLLVFVRNGRIVEWFHLAHEHRGVFGKPIARADANFAASRMKYGWPRLDPVGR